MTLPRGAAEIVEARANGMKPADSVVVNLGDRLPWSYPQVFPWRSDHDWLFLAGLEVIVSVGADKAMLRPVLRALAKPCGVVDLWDSSTRKGAIVYPVWKIRGSVRMLYPALVERQDATFVRFGVIQWPESANEEFMQSGVPYGRWTNEAA